MWWLALLLGTVLPVIAVLGIINRELGKVPDE